MNKLSAIISAFHETPIVVRHVEEIMKSKVVPDEIIVVNDHGDPKLEGELKNVKKNTNLIYAWIEDDIKWNYTGARNLGVWLSKGDYLSIEDYDHIPDRDYYKGAIEILDSLQEVGKARAHKRKVVSREDILNKPMEEWNVLSKRSHHKDCAVYRRWVYLKVKGYDERFAGAYGWSATDWRRRLMRANIKQGHCSCQYVLNTPPTRGLSSRNYQLARRQNDYQSPQGILNFKYKFKLI